MIWVNIKHLSFIFALKDTAGQEQFHALNPIYYREAAGKLHCFAASILNLAAIIVYDITDSGSFSKVETWINELKLVVGDIKIIFIVANKCDREAHRKVTASAGEE